MNCEFQYPVFVCFMIRVSLLCGPSFGSSRNVEEECVTRLGKVLDLQRTMYIFIEGLRFTKNHVYIY